MTEDDTRRAPASHEERMRFLGARKLTEIGRKDHIRIWLANGVEQKDNPLWQLPDAPDKHLWLYRGFDIEYIESVLTDGIGWPQVDPPRFWADQDPQIAWQEPVGVIERAAMVVKVHDIQSARYIDPDPVIPQRREWNVPDDPYAALVHVALGVLPEDRSNLCDTLRRIGAVVLDSLQ